MLYFFIALSAVFGVLCVVLAVLLLNAHKKQKKTAELLSTASHDICSPLSNIKGFCDILRDGTVSAEQQDGILAVISDEADRISRLAFAIGKQKTPALSVFGVGEVLCRTAFLFEKKASCKGVVTEALISDDEIYVNADKDMITEVLVNLFSNAVKYCDDGGKIIYSAKAEGKKCRISVKNTGKIGTEDAKKLFLKSFRAKNSRGTDGRGLGLYISADIIEAHGEKLCFCEKDGMCEFYFYLPVAE